MNRCGKCTSCLRVAAARRSVLNVANPPFSHADTDTALFWNQVLADNICDQVSPEERDRQLTALSQLPTSVRPQIPAS